MKWYSLIFFKIITFSFVMFACKERIPEAGTTSMLGDSVDVFIAGAVSPDDEQWNTSACYWVNDSLHILDDYSVANDVLTLGEEVIAAGKYKGRPCLWRGGKRTILDELRLGEVKAIGIHEGEIYLVGDLYEDQSNFQAFIWKEGKMTLLSDFKSSASDIAFRGNDTYVSGMDSERPCYWKNGVRFFLSEYLGYGCSMAMSDNDLFVAGEYRSENGRSLTGYWKNGAFQPSLDNSCYVWNIGLKKDKVFLVGTVVVNGSSDNAVLIVDDKISPLSAPKGTWSGANDVGFNKEDEYVLGSVSDASADNHHSRVCYWLNGKLHEVCKQKSVGMRIHLRPVK